MFTCWWNTQEKEKIVTGNIFVNVPSSQNNNSEDYGAQVSELIPYDTERCHSYVKIGLMVRNLDQSHVIFVKFWLTSNL